MTAHSKKHTITSCHLDYLYSQPLNSPPTTQLQLIDAAHSRGLRAVPHQPHRSNHSIKRITGALGAQRSLCERAALQCNAKSKQRVKDALSRVSAPMQLLARSSTGSASRYTVLWMLQHSVWNQQPCVRRSGTLAVDEQRVARRSPLMGEVARLGWSPSERATRGV